MRVIEINDRAKWEEFLLRQKWSPFLQSYAMGEVYRSIGEEPIRIAVMEEGEIVAICQGIIVHARRGKHMAVMYGLGCENDNVFLLMVEELKRVARERKCVFIRMSPFEVRGSEFETQCFRLGFRCAPLHMLAEHVWILHLEGKSEDDILAGMRKTTRNLIRRAEHEGVTIELSSNPVRDLPEFFRLYDETRRRHHFVPYPESFIRAQVEEFSRSNQCALYLAKYMGEVVSASVHMIYGGETSYHHGASTAKYTKCFASYLLQWRAIQDAIRRGDRIYNFWGISPDGITRHPFSGVRTFKTGFGGEMMELMHCRDLPLSPKYALTYGIEVVRKWKRGF